MYHIFFIHSSVDGHLGCFHVLTIVNSAAMNIWGHISFNCALKEAQGIKKSGQVLGNITIVLMLILEVPGNPIFS